MRRLAALSWPLNRNIISHAPDAKARKLATMLKAIRAAEDALAGMKLTTGTVLTKEAYALNPLKQA